jgi:hypothetical protein
MHDCALAVRGRMAARAPPHAEGQSDMSYSLPEVLAHAIALENEAAERYLELADMMEAHRNDALWAVPGHGALLPDASG